MTVTHAHHGHRSLDIAFRLAVAALASALAIYTGLRILTDLRR